jgi:urea transporter
MQFVILSLFDDLMSQLGINTLIKWAVIFAIGGGVLALFFAGFLKPVAKNIKPGYFIAGVILASIAVGLISTVQSIFAGL